MSDYQHWSYWKKPLTLNELIDEIESADGLEPPDNLVILPPINANDDVTDEDSGEENDVSINNLPGSQLRAEADIIVEEWDSDDEKPLATFVKHKPKKIKHFNYSNDDLRSDFPEWQPEYVIINKRSPLEYFQIFFDEVLIKQLVSYSNNYAIHRNRTGDIEPSEMYCFVGVLLLSGYCIVPRKIMYWQNSEDSHNKLVTESISRDRFQHIMSNIHCCDNAKLNPGDKFAKMRPLFDELNRKFIEYAQKEENHCVDEAMIPYYGKHGCKQFIRGKPIRWGYKFWVGATRLGYIVYFEPYQGSSTKLPDAYKHLGLGATVVLNYADVLQTAGLQNFHIYFDNFFTSPSLLKELKLRNIKATGTVRENRIPKCPLRDSKQMKKQPRGTYDYILLDKEIVFCKWNDNSVVTIGSNALPINPPHQAKRYCQAQKKFISIEQPKLVKNYNENMGGVDRSDQNIGKYRVSIRGKKWYFSLIAHCIDMAVQNAWHLHRNDGGKLNFLDFRRSITLGLLETNKRIFKRGPSKSSSNLHQSSRYDRQI